MTQTIAEPGPREEFLAILPQVSARSKAPMTGSR